MQSLMMVEVKQEVGVDDKNSQQESRKKDLQTSWKNSKSKQQAAHELWAVNPKDD